MLATVQIGDIGPGKRKLLNFDRTSAYDFTLTKASTLSVAGTLGTKLNVTSGGEVVASGTSLSSVLPVGHYTLSATKGRFSAASVKMSLLGTDAPTRLQANVWGSGAVRLNWDDNSTNERAFRVDRWTRVGWRRSVRVETDATAAVIDGLQPGASVTYRVSSVTAEGVSTRSANTVSATTSPTSTEGFYKVTLSAGTQGEAGWTLAKDTLKVLPSYRDGNNKMKSKWVFASSWQAATWTVVSSWSDSTSLNEDVSIKTTDTDSDGPETQLPVGR